MTTIAWDGKTLAADKMVSNAGLSRTTTKVFRVKGHLVFGSGNIGEIMKFVKWFRSGGQFPQTDDASFYVITPKKVIKCYEAEAPFIVEDRVFATGSGRDYALAAMHCGKSAKEAVEVAAFFDINTGKGIDVFKP